MALATRRASLTKGRLLTTLIAVFALVAQPMYGLAAGQIVRAVEPGVYTPTAPVAKPSLTGDVIFDSIPNAIPGNSVSQAFQATKTQAFGDKITFAGTSRNLSEAAFTLSSWACENGLGASCLTTPGSTFNHPITLNLYQAGAGDTVGSLIATKTANFDIPYRPSADPTCAGGTAWRSTNGTCYNGFNNVINFDLSGITVPETVIYSLAFNTQTYGEAPIGTTGPYDSLNVSVGTTNLVGTNVDSDSTYWDSTYSGRPTGLSIDSGWASTGNPAVIFTAMPANTAPVVTFAAPTPSEGSTVSGTIVPHVLATDDYGMGSYYIRLWKGAFESGLSNLVSNNCYSAPGAYLLGTAQDITCPSIDTTTLTDGTYVLSAQFQDGSIVSGQALRTFTVDNNAPVAPVLSATDLISGGVTNHNSVTATWTKPSDDTVKYEYRYWNDIDGNQWKESNPWTTTVTDQSRAGDFTEGEGTHYMQVVAIDAAGHRSEPSNAFKVTYDKTIPGTTITSAIVSGNSLNFIGTVSDINLNYYYYYLTTNQTIIVDGHTFTPGQEVRLNNNTDSSRNSETVWANGETGFTGNLGGFNITGVPAGEYTIHLVAFDMAGNTNASDPTQYLVTIDIQEEEIIEEEEAVIPTTPIASQNNNQGETPSPAPQTFIQPLNQFALFGGNASNVVDEQNTPTPPNTNNDSDVLGEQDQEDGTPLADTGEVLGVMDSKLFGIAWYWWLAIVAALVGGWLLIAAAIRRNREDEA